MIPSHLYHYTSVETLLLILENNTFRFNRLDRMNDPLEGKSELFPDSRQNVFVSSWTSEDKDELPMWKIYNDLRGIRLKMPIDMFNHSNELIVAKLNNGDNYLIKSNLNESYLINREKLEYKTDDDADDELKLNSVYGPTKVDYCESELNINKDLVIIKEEAEFDLYEINLHLIGQKKIDYWNFEKEYRYRIFYGNAIKFAGSKNILDKLFSNTPITTKYINIKFKKESLENLEIVLGPNIDSQAKDQIEKKLKERNIKRYRIYKSRIKIS